MTEHRLARRRFLVGSASLVGALAVGGCRDDPEAPAATAPADDGPNAGDIDLLVALGQIEHGLARGFGALAEARAAEVAAAGLAERLAFHADAHGTHRELLADAIDSAGGEPSVAAQTFTGMELPADDDLTDLPIEALLVALTRAEAAAVATAADAVGRISQPGLRGLVADIGAADAGLRQSLLLARGGLTALDLSDVPDGLTPLDGSYLAS